MTWHRSDDRFPEHPKCDALAEHFGDDWATCNVAFTTWHHMGCDCAARRTDGVFNAARAYRVIRAPREVIDAALAGLLKVGLLEKHRHGYVFHDWHDYQPTRAELDAERASKTERQRRWRENRREKSHDVDGGVDASTSRRVDGGGDGGVEGAPSRPVPSRPDQSERLRLSGAGACAPAREASPPAGAASGATDEPSAQDIAATVARLAAEEAARIIDEQRKADEARERAAAEARRAKRAAKNAAAAAKPDKIPLPGTLARKIYDAIVSDAALAPITANPGDASERWADPATFPGVDVLAQVRRAAEYLTSRPDRYTDGRAFLRGWLQREADRVARAPRPAVTAAPRDATKPAPRPAHITVAVAPPPLTPEQVAEIERNRERGRAVLAEIQARVAAAAKGGAS